MRYMNNDSICTKHVSYACSKHIFIVLWLFIYKKLFLKFYLFKRAITEMFVFNDSLLLLSPLQKTFTMLKATEYKNK